MPKPEEITSTKGRKKIVWITLSIALLLGIIAILLFAGWLKSEPAITKQANEKTNQLSFQEAPDNCQENSDWSMDTKWTLNASGVPGHDRSPVGSLESIQWLLFETHRDSSSGEVLEAFVGAIPAGQVMWLSGHAGGTGWYICVSSMEELQNRLQQHADNLLRRDGIEQTIVVLPEDISLMDSILEELQTEPVK